jgi:hypothetical protein
MLEAKTTEREIEVELSDAEREEWRQRFEKAYDKEQVAVGARDADLAKHRKALRDIRKDLENLRSGVKTGKAKKVVQCYERRNERLGQVEYVDKATGEPIESLTRPMTAEERKTDTRQEAFLDADGKTVRAKSNGKANGKPELHKDPLKASVGELVGDGVKDGRKKGKVADLNEARAKKKKGRARPQPEGVA